jgi:uncharacterized protein (TIGR02246 family)
VNPLEEASIRQLLETYKAAVHAKDVEAFAALFADDVRVFDMWGRWSHDGVAAWRAMAAEWFGSVGTDRVVVEFDDVQVLVAQDLAIAHAFVTFKGVSAEGVESRAMNNRLTWGLRRHGEGWKVVHEHTSAPVDPETGKVMLKR